MAQSSLHIELLGASFSIRADEDQGYLNTLLSSYEKTIDQVRRATGLADPLKLAIVAALVLADESTRTAKGVRKERVRDGDEKSSGGEEERILVDLIARIDETLNGSTDPENSA